MVATFSTDCTRFLSSVHYRVVVYCQTWFDLYNLELGVKYSYVYGSQTCSISNPLNGTGKTGKST